jgi:16S rRNA (cytosine1402-N4)-methyltransferase
LLEEVLQQLRIRQDGIYIDCTYGRGGHSQAILERLGAAGRVLAIDRDPAAVAAGQAVASRDTRFDCVQGEFSMLRSLVQGAGIAGGADGILFDLGVSSPQFDQAERGFSFTHDGPLDMRMDPTRGTSAAQWLADATEKEIASVLTTYGEERFAKRMARRIVAERQVQPITTTRRLADIVAVANPAWESGLHPATRAFQAIRIFINRELEELKSALPQALDVLAEGGRLLVISFHSLEDRIVKRFMRAEASGDQYPSDLPLPVSALRRRLRLPVKSIRPSPTEIAKNPRARSAVLRVAEKLA